jgi:hypothetical protein
VIASTQYRRVTRDGSISVEQAASRKWDVVVAGSSFASMFFVYALPTKLDVLIVEKEDPDHQDLIRNGDEPPERISQTTPRLSRSNGPPPRCSAAIRTVGGARRRASIRMTSQQKPCSG